jgi:pSer/pThr/pTyr-binding forkhead associated (FHA) protein
MVEPDRPQMTIWRIRNAQWISKPKNTHLEYVTFIAFPLKQWLKERAVISLFHCAFKFTKYNGQTNALVYNKTLI